MSLNVNTIRILLSVALFACVLFAPWWLACIFAFALAARFRAWEAIAAGILYDLLWLPAGVSFSSFDTIPLGTLITLALVFGLEPLRRQLLVGPAIV